MTRKQGDQKQAAAPLADEAPVVVTAPRPVDAQGRELDQWGLPINGPARLRALDELGKPDPNIKPDEWLVVPVVATETENG